jgi:hypothetical protein
MKFTNPEDREKFVLNSKNPIIQQMVIDTLRKNDVAVYNGTTEFDPSYPYLAWDRGSVTQWRKTNGEEELNVEEFMNKFKVETHIHKLQLNDEYEAVIDLKEKTVKVGCQTFDFGTINKLSTLIKKKI